MIYIFCNLKKKLLKHAIFCAAVAVFSLLCCGQPDDTVNLQDFSIIIDAGHGGIDSGAEYHGIREKDVNLTLSLVLGELLHEEGATVAFTRQSDVDYYTKGKGGKRSDLLKRVELINNSDADFFISIHCNASADERWHGAQVYYNPSNDDNAKLAVYLQQELREMDSSNKRSEKADEEILLLKDAQKTGVLVEAGFLSNKKDAAMLQDEKKLRSIADRLVSGIKRYLAQKAENHV